MPNLLAMRWGCLTRCLRDQPQAWLRPVATPGMRWEDQHTFLQEQGTLALPRGTIMSPCHSEHTGPRIDTLHALNTNQRGAQG